MDSIKVLSLFDGISCGMIALERAGIKIEKYVAYEIDYDAIKISKKNYPEIEHKGDVFKAKYIEGEYDLLIGGSPCTYWSIANKNRETINKGLGWDLFNQYVRALKEVKPKYFLYENNYSISKEIQNAISKELGVQPIMINSLLVSAQSRKRLYWTNIPNITLPNNKHIYLKDVLKIKNNEKTFDKIIKTEINFKVKVRKNQINKKELANYLREHKNKSNKEIAKFCNVPITKVEHWFRLDNSFSIPDEENWFKLKQCLNIKENYFDKEITEFEYRDNKFDMAKRIYHINGKYPTLTTQSGAGKRKNITDGKNLFCLTPLYCERLQTLPDNYTEGISDTKRFKVVGNGWTVDVIAHILSFIPKDDLK